jgi:hypothetical protein
MVTPSALLATHVDRGFSFEVLLARRERFDVADGVPNCLNRIAGSPPRDWTLASRIR